MLLSEKAISDLEVERAKTLALLSAKERLHDRYEETRNSMKVGIDSDGLDEDINRLEKETAELELYAMNLRKLINTKDTSVLE